MEICKNKKTRKSFIYLDENDHGQAVMITPNGEIKALAYDLFTEPVDTEDARTSLEKGIISDTQYETYCKYHQL